MFFNIATEELKKYRDKTGLGLSESKDKLLKEKMIKHLEEGGASEPVLLQLLRDWNNAVQDENI